MRDIFYDNLIKPHKESLLLELSTNLHHLEQEEILELIEETLHQRILTVILTELPNAYHEHFLVRFKENPSDTELFTFLKFHSPQIDQMIQEVALITIEEIKSDLLVSPNDLNHLFD